MNIPSLLLETVHHTNEGITLADIHSADAPLMYANDAFCRMTGYAREEVIGRNCRFLQGENSDSQTAFAIGKAIRDRASGTFELYNYRKDGTGFWNRLSLTPIYKDKELLCYAGIQSDITHYKESTELMEQHHANLIKMMSMVSGEMQANLKEMILQIERASHLYDPAQHTLQQLSLLVTMIETDSTDILNFVRHHG